MVDAFTIDNKMLNTGLRQREDDSTTVEDSGELPVLAGRKYQLNAFNKAVSEWFKEKKPSNSNEETQYPISYPSQSDYVIYIVSADSHLMRKGEILNWTDYIISAFTGIQATFSISYLRSEYFLTNEIDISRFLAKCSFLIPLLNEAYIQIQTYFPQSNVYLKISRDHESTELYEELVAIIDTNLPVKDTMRQLDKFDENWWYDNIDRAQDLLIIRV